MNTVLARPVDKIANQRSKENYRLIGVRYGRVIKINRNEKVPSHGFISNTEAEPVIYFDVRFFRYFFPKKKLFF